MEKKDIQILLAEDDLNLGFVIKDTLEDEGYDVKLCTDGVAALQAYNEKSFDLCLLDVMMPFKDGFTVAENIRKVNPDMPIIFLTAKALMEDKVKGLGLGADDYITKPFDNEEFLLRIENVLRRTGKRKQRVEPDEFGVGIFTLDTKNLTLTSPDGTEQKLTAKEAKILKLLCLHVNSVVERDVLLNTVWGKDDYFTGRSMDVFITKLRKYLKDDASVKIQNIHGVGFKLEIG
jgi:DNA-binding response OmpR family regulator